MTRQTMHPRTTTLMQLADRKDVPVSEVRELLGALAWADLRCDAQVRLLNREGGGYTLSFVVAKADTKERVELHVLKLGALLSQLDARVRGIPRNLSGHIRAWERATNYRPFTSLLRD